MIGRGLARVGLLLALAFLGLPLLGLFFRTPWSSLGTILTSEELSQTLRLSLVTSVAATVGSVLLGLPLAWTLVKLRQGWRRRLLMSLALLPMVLPPVVGGVALLFAFGRRGLFGRLLETWFGVELAFTTAGAALAATFVALPFFVLSAQAGLRAVDWRLVESGRILGASRAGHLLADHSSAGSAGSRRRSSCGLGPRPR